MTRLVSWRIAADQHDVAWGQVVAWIEDGTLSAYEIDGDTMIDDTDLRQVLASSPIAGRPRTHRPLAIAPGTLPVAKQRRLVSITAGVTREERIRINEVAAAAGMSTAAWARAALVHAANTANWSDGHAL